MLNALSISVPLIIALALLFTLFCIALMVYEKKEDDREVKRKTTISFRESGTRSGRPA